jgi:hypothetical protein
MCGGSETNVGATTSPTVRSGDRKVYHRRGWIPWNFNFHPTLPREGWRKRERSRIHHRGTEVTERKQQVKSQSAKVKRQKRSWYEITPLVPLQESDGPIRIGPASALGSPEGSPTQQRRA